MECIKMLRPLLYNFLQETILEHSIIETIRTKDSREGDQYTTFQVDGQVIRMNSMYSPKDEAACWASQFEFNNMDIVAVMYGFGNGYCVRELINKLQAGHHIIVTEPSYEMFLHVLTYYDISDILLDERVSIVIIEYDCFLYKRLLESYIDWINIQTVMVCIHPQYNKCFDTKLNQFYQALQEVRYTALVNRNTEIYFAKDRITNTLKNIDFIQDSNTLMEYMDKFPRDMTAIIIAAGPSLDKNIDLLKEAKGKSLIIATDTALRYLHRKGIHADVVVTLDPRKPENYFDGVEFEQLPLFCSSEANAAVLSRHQGKKIWIRSNDFINREYEVLGHKIDQYNTGGSVACAAFMICIALKFKRIVMVGQDLAYNGAVTHAGGEICKILDEEDGICYVEGIDGKSVRSRHDWYVYLMWFEDAIKTIKKDVQVIDATEGGAMIHGAEIMSLREVIDQYCTEPVETDTIFNCLAPTFNSEEMIQFAHYIKQGYEDLKLIENLANKNIVICNKLIDILYRENSQDQITTLSKEITASNSEMMEKPVMSLVNTLLMQEVTNSVESMGIMEKNEKLNQQKTYESTSVIMKAIQKVCRIIEPDLKGASDKFERGIMKNE